MSTAANTQADDCCASSSLISVDEALSQITNAVDAVKQTETLHIEGALGRVLVEDVYSSINVPGYDNSAMDGYAVRSQDCSEQGVTLRVSQRISAGQTGKPLEAGTAARIFTGAPVPVNADAVVMQEACELNDKSVTVNTIVKAGSHIRRVGEDIKTGSIVLEAGHVIRPQELGLLASVGLSEIRVKRKLKVATFFTGDELVEPGNKLDDGQIYNSNKYVLKGLLRTTGCEIVDLGIVPDTLEDTLDVLKKASEKADLVITSGGVSVGEEDYVRIALEQLGELTMWRIAMKPGKPVAYGKVGNAVFMGLPGNPVSVFVTFLIFARPLIHKMQGAETYLNTFTNVRAAFDWPAGKRQEYLRVRIEHDATGTIAKLFPHQGSGVLSSTCWADGLIEVLPNQLVKSGDSVKYLAF